VHPADDNEMKMAKVRVSCVACAVCGESVQESSGMNRLWSSWGLGCARECSQLLCQAAEIWDWMQKTVGSKCVDCAAQRDAQLCSPADFDEQDLQSFTVTGHLSMMYFDRCRGVGNKLDEITYGRCLTCAREAIVCEEQAAYPESCGPAARDHSVVGTRELEASCDVCASRQGALDVVQG
jgi:hypothetical protein